MAGTGAVYIRLLKDLPSRNMIEISDDSDFEVHSKVEKPCDTDSDSSFELPPVVFRSLENVSACSNELFPVVPQNVVHSTPNSNCPILDTLSSTHSAVSCSTTRSPVHIYSPIRSTNTDLPIHSTTHSHSTVRSTTLSPVRSTTCSPVHSTTHSPVCSTTYSPATCSPVRSTTHLPVRSTTHSPVRSTTRSPVRSTTCSPVRSTTRSPVHSTVNTSSTHSPLTDSFLDLLSYSPISVQSSSTSTLSSLQQLQNLYPSFSLTALTTILEICNDELYKALHLLDNCTLNNLLSLLKGKFIGVGTGESPKIHIDPDISSEDSLRLLLSFYKSKRFLRNAHVQVVINGGSVVDDGGVHRQLYCSAFEALATGYMGAFDGPLSCVRPTIKPSNIVSGLLRNIGTAIAHSLIMDGAGFPYLSLPMYYYLADKEDVAVTHLSISDACGQAFYVLSRVC